MTTIDRWGRCEACQTTRLSCALMHRDTHTYCCTSCEHDERIQE